MKKNTSPGVTEKMMKEMFARLLNIEVTPAVMEKLVPVIDGVSDQRAFLAALGALQAESVARYGRPWLGLGPEQRAELLAAASAGPPSREPRYWTPGQPVLVPEPPELPPTLRDRFDLLKERIAATYYSSEAGMKELGWTGNLIHQAFPGCPHPGGHGAR